MRSHNELSMFLGSPETKKVLSTECVLAVIQLQNSLRSRESKLAAYQRMTRKNTMDACTTSPAESNNYSIKHIFECTSRVNIDKAVTKVCTGTDDRIKRRKNKAMRSLGKRNTASCAPTAPYLNIAGQGLGDRNFDDSIAYKSAQLDHDSFISWNFDVIDIDETNDDDEFSHLRMCKYFVPVSFPYVTV